MGSEERWANRREAESTRGEVEIKSEENLQPGDSVCFWRGCDEPAVKLFVVGLVAKVYSRQEIMLCGHHAKDAIEFYADQAE